MNGAEARSPRSEAELSALVFDVQGHAVHDGPGCRTLVFLSGCPLACSWCANPEGRLHRRRRMYTPERCPDGCLRCLDACPLDAVRLSEGGAPRLRFDADLCGACDGLECASACYTGALEVCGRRITLAELMAVLRRDRDYWGPRGGVTFSGGEPLAQPEFVQGALEACREAWIPAALETCLHVPEADLAAALPLADVVLADVKHMDPEVHRAWTGQDNATILRNFRAAAAFAWEGRLLPRLPLVPGFNDSPENLRATADFLREIGLGEIQILPYHRLGNSKYGRLGLEAPPALLPPGPKAVAAAAETFRELGVRCWTGDDDPF